MVLQDQERPFVKENLESITSVGKYTAMQKVSD